MFAANLLKTLRLATTAANGSSSSNSSNLLIQCQQVRNMARKQPRFRYAYGANPLFQEDDFQKSVEESRLDDLKYEKIRFAQLSENSSPLYDADLERFARIIMEGSGRKGLAYDLMHRTFYTIKTYQLAKYRKLLAKIEKKETGAQGNKETGPVDLLAATDEETLASIETNPMTIFKQALANSEPLVIVRKVKRGGATYQVPFPIQKSQGEWFAAKWLVQAVRDRPKRRVKLFPEIMAQELIDAASNRGKVVKKKDDIHRLANSNRAYAHYRWG